MKTTNYQKNNKQENSKCIPHEYTVNDKVLLSRSDLGKFGHDPYDGPYTITQIFNNGTVQLKMGPVYQVWNIRNLKPYNE
jgi:hypothetical protein